MVKPQFEVGRERVGKGGVVRDPALRREALVAVAAARARLGAPCSASRPSGLPGPAGNRETFVWLAEGGRAGAVARLGGGARGGGAHDARRVRDHAPARRRDQRGVRELIEAARRAGVSCASTPTSGEARAAARDGIELDAPTRRRRRPVHRAGRRRHDPHRAAPVRRHRHAGVRGQLRRGRVPGDGRPRRPGRRFDRRSRATSRRSRCRRSRSGAPRAAGRRSTTSPSTASRAMRVADLSYALAGEEIGRVRCDGLVVSTPPGSTGYNLANGGPVLAWGVEGYVVSFIAPHSLTARALVVAPGRPADDQQRARARSRSRSTSTAGRRCELPPGEDLHVEFARSHGDARPAAGGELLPPPARAVRPARAQLNSLPESRRTARLRRAPGWYTVRRAARAARREPAADRAGRAGLGPGPQRADRRDRGGQDGARPRARPAAGRQAARRASCGPGAAEAYVEGVFALPAALRDGARRAPARGRRRARARPPRERRGPHARVCRRPLRHRGRPARRSAARCSPSTASTSTAG